MLFNSYSFFVFFIFVFFSYWFLFNRNLKLQNAFLAIVSFVFYASWDWRFLLLLLLSLIVDFSVPFFMDDTQNQKKRKGLLVFSLLFNLGLLCFFKYFNFFIENATIG